MVIAEAVAGAAAGAHALWDYNRGNFLYDRKMRQETELKILEWRAEMSELWRDDVRDIVGLTEKKMDSYLIVSTLLLGMCLGLFTEGRLQPGTPPWLIHFYTLTLSASFMYLLLSIWLAVHASIVAQCSAVRILTQFVRLPIPTWEALQNMRTFASSYEKLDAKDMLRVPFTRNPSAKTMSMPKTPTAEKTPMSPERPSVASAATGPIDPWRLEQHSEDRHLYELQHMPALRRRHVRLARQAAQGYQAYDAFARVSVAFGTHQLMLSLCYYCLGYIALQDGAPWASVGVLGLMCVMTVSLVQLDFEMSRKEFYLAILLIAAGPVCTGAATYTWVVYGIQARILVMVLLPLTYASHGLWLFFALVACGLEVQPKTGVILPQRFRAVLYMDVFDVRRKQASAAQGEHSPDGSLPMQMQEQESASREQSRSLRELKREIEATMKLFQSETVKGAMDHADRERANELVDRALKATKSEEKKTSTSSPCASRLHSMASIDEDNFVLMKGYTDFGAEVEYLYNPKSGEARPLEEDEVLNEPTSPGGLTQASSVKTEGQKVRTMTEFDAAIEELCVHQRKERLPKEAFRRSESIIMHHVKKVVTPVVKAVIPEISEEDEEEQAHLISRDITQEGIPAPSGQMSSTHAKFDALTFIPDDNRESEESEIVSGHDKVDPRKFPATVFRLATLLMVSLWTVGLMVPFGVLREFMTKPLVIDFQLGGSEKGGEEEVQAVVGTKPDGLPELIPVARKREDLQQALQVHRIKVKWPFKSGFSPRTLSSDQSGTLLVAADDLGVYAGQVIREAGRDEVHFRRVPPCVALEGQAIQDVSVACGPDFRCRVLVLHAKGHRLAECPVGENFADSRAQRGYRTVANVAALPSSEPKQWEIPDTWLHTHSKFHRGRETIKALAINGNCMGDFKPQYVGCVVVGTSEGRIVELRRTGNATRTLVPERAMEQRNEALTAGSLHFSSKGYVMALRRSSHRLQTLQAFSAKGGTHAGECDAQLLALSRAEQPL
ncbi:unnamed protein product [Effrenium voratum]|nr:unnamed protein product [Effrenium voratum]